jgi:radical SAM protein with 4Fe4S-binding SPASM domain
MDTIPKHYNVYRRAHELIHLSPNNALKWIANECMARHNRQRGKSPITIAIEATNHCNRSCATCPHPNLLSSEKGFMELDLFKTIADEFPRLPALTSVAFTGFGEPLLHPELIAMSRYVKDKGIPIVRTYTNGILLKEKSEDILQQSGFDEIILSLNGANPAVHETITQSKEYCSIIDNIEYFFKKRRALNKRTPFISLQILKLNDVAYNKEAFIRHWQPLLRPGDCILFKESHTFAGQVGNSKVKNVFHPAKRVPCGHLWNFLLVAWNGEVLPCCVDPHRKLSIGSSHHSSLMDLWHSTKLEDMRNKHLQGRYEQMDLCRDCETWRYFT